jgi:hypothetical protein
MTSPEPQGVRRLPTARLSVDVIARARRLTLVGFPVVAPLCIPLGWVLGGAAAFDACSADYGRVGAR